MKSCKLIVKNEGLPTQSFEVVVTETTANDKKQKVDSEEIANFRSPDINKVAAFMSKYDVTKHDLSDALKVMDDNGHNVANFGWFGGFVFSSYEGTVQ